MNIPLKPVDWLFPLTILSFHATSITFLNGIFTTTTRWGFLTLLFSFFFVQYRFANLFKDKFIQILLLNCAWVALTTVWSHIPLLTLMKAGAYVIALITLIYAAQLWIYQHKLENALDFMWLTAFFSLLAAIFGYGATDSVINTGAAYRYQGLVSGTNMLGALIAMSMPWIIWKGYVNWNRLEYRIFWLGVGSVGIVFLFMANSRAAIIATLFCFVSLTYSFGYRKWVPIAITAVSLFIASLFMSPQMYDTAVDKYVYKNMQKQGVLYSREQVWDESFRLAQEGGWIGAGVGVTIGDDSFGGGLTAIGYGREKGNSQLAIMEETGYIGMIFYAILLISLFHKLISKFNICTNHHLRVLLGVCIGSLTGMIFQSFFEAWWLAPGAPEFIYFWAMVGLSLGVCNLIDRNLYHTRQANLKTTKVIN